jgi:hypothetical protein
MKTIIQIEVDASETITDTIKRGTFTVDRDGSGHKITVGDNVVVPSRKCKVTYKNAPTKSKSKKE